MNSQCSFSPEPLWIREVSNGMRRVTLRRNITQQTVTQDEGQETVYNFEETDVFIPDRESVQDYVTANFDALFTLGLQQVSDNDAQDAKIQQATQMVKDGSVVDALQTIGQQITNVMLGV